MPRNPVKTILLIAFLLLLALPATAAVPPGRITVYSSPSGANACIDNKDCEITPATFAVEGNAWHMIVVTEKGYRDWTDTIYVSSDLTSTANAYLDLDPAATAIHVNVTPGGGTVCLDNTQCRAPVGMVNGTGSTLYTGVSPGYHTISVESPVDYLDTTKLVEVELGKVSEINIMLEAFIAPPTPTKAPPVATGLVRVYVDRKGSTICIDNAHCVYNVGGNPGPGTGTTVFDLVTANETHIVTVAADGYEPFSKTVMVDKDTIQRVDVSLQPIAGVITVPTTTSPPVSTLVATTTLPVTTTTPPPTMPLSTRSGLDALPLLGALALCGIALRFTKDRE
jgi:hypothetical protein